MGRILPSAFAFSGLLGNGILADISSSAAMFGLSKVVTGSSIVKIKIGQPYTVAGAGQLDIYATDSNGFPTGSSLATKTFTSASSALKEIVLDSTLTGLTIGDVYCFRFSWISGSYRVTGWSHSDVLLINSGDTGASWYHSGSYGSLAIDYGAGYVSEYGVASGSGHGYTGGVAIYNVSGSRVARGGFKLRSPVDLSFRGVTFDVVPQNNPSSAWQLKAELCSSSAVLATSLNRQYANNGGARNSQFVFDPYTMLANTDYYVCMTPDGSNDGASGYCPYIGHYEAKVNVDVSGGIVRDYHYSTGTSISWTKDNTKSSPVSVFFDLPSGGGGGGLLVNPGMNGGMI